MSAKQHEIWFANLEPSVGSEPGKIRPVVVIQSDILNNAGHRTTIVCALSSQSKAGVSFIRLAINPSAVNGLQKTSYILCDQVRAIDVSRLKTRIGVLEQIDINRLHTSIQAIISV